MIIALISPCPGCGKSTVAKYLTRPQARRQALPHLIPLAAPLKGMLATLLEDFGIGQADIRRYINGDWKEKPILEIPGNPTARYLMQTLGTEWGRNLIHEDLWVQAWKRKAVRAQIVVVDDVRFLSEYNALPGAQVWRITNKKALKAYRESLPRTFWHRLLRITPKRNHTSEGELSSAPVNAEIANDGTLDELYAKIDELLK